MLCSRHPCLAKENAKDAMPTKTPLAIICLGTMGQTRIQQLHIDRLMVAKTRMFDLIKSILLELTHTAPKHDMFKFKHLQTYVHLNIFIHMFFWYNEPRNGSDGLVPSTDIVDMV